MTDTAPIPEVAQLDRLRTTADVTISDLTKEFLSISRAGYYNWLAGAKVRKSRMSTLKHTSKIIALGIKSGTLPVSADLIGKQRRQLTVQCMQELSDKLDWLQK